MVARDDGAAPPLAELAAALIHSRRTVLPRWLGAPGPDADQLQQIFWAAAAAPDHGQLCPWRFVRVPAQARDRLGNAFAQALRERDAAASDADCAKASAKAHHAPELMLAVVRLGADRPGPARGDGKVSPPVGDAERLVSLGCALQNMQLMAHALGFGAALTSGQALESVALRRLFDLDETEQAVCFLSIGTVLRRPGGLLRPRPSAFVQTLGLDPAGA
jgi:nitroreductase